MPSVDEVFRSLADPTRRSLLDELFRQDGQSLSELEGRFAMSRFGVMKHLRQLEEAGLVVTRRRGREKLHFLNPVPDPARPRPVGQQVRRALGGNAQWSQEQTGAVRWRRYSRSTSARRRSACGRRSPTARSGASTNSVPGSPRTGRPARGTRWVPREPPGLLGEGENLEIDPPRRLVQSMTALWSDDVKSEGASRITWEIEPVGDSCRLTVTHDQLREGANNELYGGWPMILSGLKTWLETGELLTTPGSLMYS